jgi:hypothetical protein
MILYQTVAGIPQVNSAAVDLFLNAILICWVYSQIFELFPHFQRIYYMCLCIVILCCILLMEQKHIFSFLNIYF